MNSKAYSPRQAGRAAPSIGVARPRLRLAISFDHGSVTQVPAITFELLRRLARLDSLREAANGAGLSYRYAWGLIRSAEQVFGAALIDTRRGRGTSLTDYGALLAAALTEIELQLAPELDAASNALTAALALGAAGTARVAEQRAAIAPPARIPAQAVGLAHAWRQDASTGLGARADGQMLNRPSVRARATRSASPVHAPARRPATPRRPKPPG